MKNSYEYSRFEEDTFGIFLLYRSLCIVISRDRVSETKKILDGIGFPAGSAEGRFNSIQHKIYPLRYNDGNIFYIYTRKGISYDVK